MSNQSAAKKSKEYVRPMPVTWWLDRKTYFLFMVRELTCLFVGGYALFLLVLLGQANDADAFASILNSPLSVVLHLVALLMVLYHSITWINLTPKVMVVWRGEDRVSPKWIAAANYVVWVALSLSIFGICWKIAGT